MRYTLIQSTESTRSTQSRTSAVADLICTESDPHPVLRGLNYLRYYPLYPHVLTLGTVGLH